MCVCVCVCVRVCVFVCECVCVCKRVCLRERDQYVHIKSIKMEGVDIGCVSRLPKFKYKLSHTTQCEWYESLLLAMQCSVGRSLFLSSPCSTEVTEGRWTSCRPNM